ncbi:MAG: hypothetical protein KBF88_17230 [Polyangiaceae bacterium]|nr:hypothetical protein [Polyangiaceae bacterium]
MLGSPYVRNLGLLFSMMGAYAAGCGSSTEDTPDAGADSSTTQYGGEDGSTLPGDGSSGPDGTPVVVTPVTSLPALPELSVTSVVVNGDAVHLALNPVDTAKDYRIYELPADGDITAASDGVVTVKNATYRCAGERQSPVVRTDSEQDQQSEETHTVVIGGVLGYTRSLADSTLGYVFEQDGPGRIPVYVLGDPGDGADIGYFFQRYDETRLKKYTTSKAERDSLVAAKWRDDGIAFWTVAADAVKTQKVYFDTENDFPGPRNLVYTDGPEKISRAAAKVAPLFDVLKATEPGAVPLKRVFYRNPKHDEIMAGNPRFERARRQGTYPITQLHWSGLTQEKVLVVEALDKGCPFGGFHSPKTIAADPPNQAFVTLADQRAASPSGEITINGQFPKTNVPKAIARAFVKVKPEALPSMDYSDEFKTFAPLTEAPCGRANCFQSFRQTSADYDISWDSVETGGYAVGNVLGELWVAYGDWAQDTGGKVRITPKKKTTLAAGNFLHVTMEVDGVSTGRRYPQILISDRDAPVQNSLPQGKTIIAQLINNWPPRYELQICDTRNWDVNDQCPVYDFYRPQNLTGPIPPIPEVGSLIGVDKSTRFDVYASTGRAYLFIDQKPYGCADLPTAKVPSGAVTVTYGDVLYHSGVDEPVLAGQLPFLKTYQLTETKRHFDNLGFKAGVAAPAWNETILPCKPTSALR